MASALRPSFAEAIAHCERLAPAEAVCGYVFEAGWRFVALENVALTPRTRFEIDPRAYARFERRALGRPCWLVHSHLDAPAELSASDVAGFTVDGAPLLPMLELAVVSLIQGRFGQLATFSFREGAWVCTGVIS